MSIYWEQVSDEKRDIEQSVNPLKDTEEYGTPWKAMDLVL
jgi:hypothetical protein